MPNRLFTCDTGALEVFLGILAVTNGLWLLLPMHTFDASVTFQPMSNLMPETGWGLALFLLGTLKIMARLRGNRQTRRICLAALTFLWGIIAITFAMANLPVMGTVTWATITLASGYCAACGG